VKVWLAVSGDNCPQKRNEAWTIQAHEECKASLL